MQPDNAGRNKSRRTRIKESRAKRNRRRFTTPDGRARRGADRDKPDSPLHAAKYEPPIASV